MLYLSDLNGGLTSQYTLITEMPRQRPKTTPGVPHPKMYPLGEDMKRRQEIETQGLAKAKQVGRNLQSPTKHLEYSPHPIHSEPKIKILRVNIVKEADPCRR